MNTRTHRLAPLVASLLTSLILGACSESESLPALPSSRSPILTENTRQAPPSFVPEFAGKSAPGRPGASQAGSSARQDKAPAGPSPTGNPDGALDRLMAWERQDFGVRPPRGLHHGESHGPTPNQLPGGQVITTKGLLPLLQQNLPVQLIDVLGGELTLPRATAAPWAAAPGDFGDRTQQQLAQFLEGVTQGNPEAPLVFFCAGPECWLSYNAALRAVHLGYRNVLWYRGGVQAWQRAGRRLEQSQQLVSGR